MNVLVVIRFSINEKSRLNSNFKDVRLDQNRSRDEFAAIFSFPSNNFKYQRKRDCSHCERKWQPREFISRKSTLRDAGPSTDGLGPKKHVLWDRGFPCIEALQIVYQKHRDSSGIDLESPRKDGWMHPEGPELLNAARALHRGHPRQRIEVLQRLTEALCEQEYEDLLQVLLGKRKIRANWHK